jgi:chromate transporter
LLALVVTILWQTAYTQVGIILLAAIIGVLIILAPIDFAFAGVLFSLLVYWKLPPWIIVITGAIGGTLMTFI